MGTLVVVLGILVAELFLAQARAATVTVINTKNNTAGSLRQAIQDAKAGDTIKFAIPKTDAGYDPVERTFTIDVAGSELAIGKNLTIDGENQRVVLSRSTGAAHAGRRGPGARRRPEHRFAGRIPCKPCYSESLASRGGTVSHLLAHASGVQPSAHSSGLIENLCRCVPAVFPSTRRSTRAW